MLSCCRGLRPHPPRWECHRQPGPRASSPRLSGHLVRGPTTETKTMSEGKTAQITKLLTTRPDTERAAELRVRAEEIGDALAKLMDDAAAGDMEVQLNCVRGPLGRHHISLLRVVKVYE